MNDTKIEYVILEMKPNDDAEEMSDRLSQYGKLGFRPLQPVLQGDYVIYTLYLETR